MRRPGNALTVLAYGTMVHASEAATEETGIDAEIIDSEDAAAAGSGDHRRLGEEDRPLRGRPPRRRSPRVFGAELAALVSGTLLLSSGSPDRAGDRLGHALSDAQEWDYFPGPARIGRALVETMEAGWMGEHTIKLPDVGEGVAEPNWSSGTSRSAIRCAKTTSSPRSDL